MTKTVNIDRREDGLILVDLQNDFCPGGALPVPEGDRVVPIANRVAPLFDNVIATQDWHPPDHRSFISSHPNHQVFDTIQWRGIDQVLWPDHCVQGTAGAQFRRDFDLRPVRLIVRKGMDREIDSYSTFRDNEQQASTGLEDALRGLGIRRVFLAGLAIDYCVLYSSRDAVKAGFEVAVIMDACRGIDRDNSVSAALDEMKTLGVALIRSEDLRSDN